ncbi:MAG: NAD(P)H-hydrate dehydratase [Flavobacteriales bacterium]|nr:NAD(P)H-hydrate dehydratase [Flavobacteriales bacterium]
MLPVLDAASIRLVDAATILREPITSADLMERAGQRLAERILHHHRRGRWGDPASITYRVVVGMGNNGGDGLVIARVLKSRGLKVTVDRLLHRSTASTEHVIMLAEAAASGVSIRDIRTADGWSCDGEVIIDALFGTGLDRPLEGMAADLVRAMNRSGCQVIAIDIPSGLFAGDNTANDASTVVRATLTLGVELPKLPFFLADHALQVGEWELVQIRLDPLALRTSGTQRWLIQDRDLASLLPIRPRFAHKGLFGHAMIMAGSHGMYGAAVLATRAALRTGVGLVTAHVPQAAMAVLHSSSPEALCRLDIASGYISEVSDQKGITAIGFGPGIGTRQETKAVLKRLIQVPSAPLVIDADGLNLLAEERTWAALLPPDTIITPHPGEFDRLHGARATSAAERLDSASAMAQRYQTVVVLKGAWTAICAPDGQVFFNPTGNPGMAKGGSGDVLTGLITGLRAQGLSALHAALLGVWAHGQAGDLAALHHGLDGMTAGDIIQCVPEAWKYLRDLEVDGVEAR